MSTSKRTKRSSLEDLLHHMVSEYKQTTTCPGGRIVRGPTKLGTVDSITVTPLCHFEHGCPANFHDFFSSDGDHSSSSQGEQQQHHIMLASVAFDWYPRCFLRYSSSSLVAAFERYLVHELKRKKTTELFSKTLQRNVLLADLEIYALTFRPRKQHGINLIHPILGEQEQQIVEALDNHSYCCHNMLKCKKTGVIVDLSLGQFQGSMIPKVYSDMNEFLQCVPGKVIDTWLVPKRSVDEQIDRDSLRCKRLTSPDSVPSSFAKRVVQAFQSGKEYCQQCLGVASMQSPNKLLMCCKRCKETFYCGKHCQLLHWQIHKQECTKQQVK